jgi:hypothetical protein
MCHYTIQTRKPTSRMCACAVTTSRCHTPCGANIGSRAWEVRRRDETFHFCGVARPRTVIFPTKKLVVPVESLDWPDWRGEADLYLIAHADLNIVPVTRTEMLKSMMLPKTEPKKSTESGSPPRLLRGLRGGEFCTICPLFAHLSNYTNFP